MKVATMGEHQEGLVEAIPSEDGMILVKYMLSDASVLAST